MNKMYIEDEAQENNSLVYRDEDSNNQPDLYQQIENLNNQQHYFEETVRQLQTHILKNDEQHKQHMMHLETVGMMSKYQLVFTKMEAAIQKLNGLIKVKETSIKFNVFSLIKLKSKHEHDLISLKSNIYSKVFTKKILNLYIALEKNIIQQEQKALKKIVLFTTFKSIDVKQKEEQEKLKRTCLQKLTSKDEEIEKARKKNEDLDAVFWQLRQRENELQQKIQQKQRFIQKLENDLLDSKKLNVLPISTTNKQHNTNILDSKLKELENNNSVLALQFQQSSSQINTFVKEMNELLDSHQSLFDFQEDYEIGPIVQRKNGEVNSFRQKF